MQDHPLIKMNTDFTKTLMLKVGLRYGNVPCKIGSLSMAEDCHIHKSQTNPRHLEKEPFEHILTKIHTRTQEGERSGSVVEC